MSFNIKFFAKKNINVVEVSFPIWSTKLKLKGENLQHRPKTSPTSNYLEKVMFKIWNGKLRNYLGDCKILFEIGSLKLSEKGRRNSKLLRPKLHYQDFAVLSQYLRITLTSPIFWK